MMYSKKDLDNLTKEYNNIETPKNLEKMMISMLKDKDKDKDKKYTKFGFAVASLVLLLIVGLNTSATFANTVKEIPLLGGVAKLLTFRVYDEKIKDSEIKIDNAIIDDNKNTVANALNEKYNEQSKKLYEDFIKKTNYNGDRTSLMSTYTIKADNGTTISIENALLEIQGSSSEKLTYDTVDLNDNVYITLESLFKDDSYVTIISENIKEQINKKITENEEQYYTDDEGFKQIATNQTFYINNNHELVIVFDEYQIAPGYIGSPEFVIPTDILKDNLVGDKYIY